MASAMAVSALSLIPILYLAVRAFGKLDALYAVLFRKSTLIVLANSVGLAAAVTLSTIIVGVLLAWLTTRSDIPGKSFWAAVTPLPLALPSYVGAYTLVAALGPRGMLQGLLEPLGIDSLPSIYGFSGAWLALTLFTYPYVLLSVRSGLRGHDPAVEEAARSLGHNSHNIFWTITFPNLRPSINAGALLVALYTLSDFGVVSMLQFNSFTRKIYIQYTASFDRNAAAVLALILVVLTFGILLFEYRTRGKTRYHGYGVGSPRLARSVPLGFWKYPALAFCSSIFLLSIVLPLSVIGYWLYHGIRSGETMFHGFDMILNTVGASGLAALVAVVAAVPIVLASVRYPGRITALFEKCAYMGHALPGIVIALSLVFFGIHCIPVLYQTLYLLIFAYVIRFLPEAIGSLRTSLLKINPQLEEAGRNLGRSPVAVFRTVTLPLLKPGLFTGFALVLLTCMKELPATLLLSPTGFHTLATRIWGSTEEAFYARAAVPALLLIATAAFFMSIIVSQLDREAYG